MYNRDGFMLLEARVKPEKVWAAWEKAHAVHGQQGLVAGVRGIAQVEGRKGFQYQILDVIPGESFSILWKALFVRLIFTHGVQPTPRGCQIRYDFSIKGPFAAAVRWFLGKKIRANLELALKTIVKQLEAQEPVRIAK